MAVNKVNFGGNTLIDMTGDTLESEEQLLKGVIAHAKDGNQIVGKLETFSGGDMTGPINMQGHPLTGLNDPIEDSDAATKGYVDNIAPTFSQATELVKLTSGEKLTVSLGKIAKAISDLISHLVNKDNPHHVTASQLSSGTLNSKRLPTVPISKGGTGATTAENARTKLGITPANIGAIDASKLITVYNVNIALKNGVGTYSNSNIKSSSRCFVQRRVGIYMSGLQSVVGTQSANGAVTVVMDTNITGDIQVNIIIFNS